MDSEELVEAQVVEHELEDTLHEEDEELFVTYEKQDLTPENTIVVFDLHHVLMRPEYKSMAKSIIRHPNKKRLLQVVASPALLRKFVNKIGSETPEKSLKDLEEEFGETPSIATGVRDTLSPLIVDICNSQKPDLPTFDVIGMNQCILAC